MRKIMMPFIFWCVTACGQDNDCRPFCSFGQLSNSPVKKIGEAVSVSPKLLKVEYPTFEKDTFLVLKTWELNAQFKIEHKAPTFLLRMFDQNVSDTLSINGNQFDIGKMLESGIVPLVKSITYYHHDGEYLLFRILNGGSGRIISSYILVFNISDRNRIVCLNEKSKIPGTTWMVRENLITDLDNDGFLEINLLDSLRIRPYIIYPDKIVPSSKVLILNQVDNDRFCIKTKGSNWYFNLKSLPANDTCIFNFDEELPPSSYD
ncbi:hypothetical protein [Chitinophaga flava]|uniref:Uncharacterized protein n=1 Tax=Chitinophaga flava TaxID=2259036 RepID=A0A365XSK0_9BACT|nr:hypothetical protein [Chitinophaga flava]RBL89110.1 hypothetical protein DF182_21480 [Chitinophaga flava]